MDIIAIKIKEYRKSERSGAYHFLAIYSDFKVMFGRVSYLEESFQEEYNFVEFLKGNFNPLLKRKFGIKRINEVKEIIEILEKNKAEPYIRKWESNNCQFIIQRHDKIVIYINESGITKTGTWSDYVFRNFEPDIISLFGKEVQKEARKMIDLFNRHSV